jgi:hypothetical protein
MAGAIITAGVIVTGVIIEDGAIIVGFSGDYSEGGRLSLAAFSFEPRGLGCVASRKSRQGFSSTAFAVALWLRDGQLRRAAVERS